MRINKVSDETVGIEKDKRPDKAIKRSGRYIADSDCRRYLNKVHSILQRMRELAIQVSTDTNTDVDRAQIQKEVDQLIEELNRISRTTEFNTKNPSVESWKTPGTHWMSKLSLVEIKHFRICCELGIFVNETTYVIEVETSMKMRLLMSELFR